MAKALITGGTGFIGSHIARVLVADGHSVRVLHRDRSKLTALDGIPFESAIGGLGEEDIPALIRASEGCDWIFHVAAVADYWRADKAQMFEVNVAGTRRILAAARTASVKRVIFTSSAAAVGMNPDGRPSDESARFNFPPDEFPYGYSKVLAERAVSDAVWRGQEVVTMNPVAVIGPGDLNMISGSFITQIKKMGILVPMTSGGIAVSDVRDVARWHVLAAQHGRVGERYLLGTANYPYSLWFAMIAEAVGVLRPRIMLPDFIIPIAAQMIDWLRKRGIDTPVDAVQTRMGVRKAYFDCRKACGELGNPQIDMRQSLRETYDWYSEHGYL
ncbi:MAG: NAD-dependent epimerase/dehydratase family protein [Phototrophicales bacterium]|nr:NAD-dependent epimerase/dehydratase family protein [Phototrophicales bacterium]